MKPGQLVLGCALCAWHLAATPQGPAVPAPRTSAAIAEQEKNAQRSLIVNGAVSMPGAIMEGSAVLNDAMKLPGSVHMLRQSRLAGELISKTHTAAGLAATAAAGDMQQLTREGVQTIFDLAPEVAKDLTMPYLTRYAITQGVSTTMASGSLGLAFSTGTLIGGYVRDTPLKSLDGRTIGSYVDDAYFNLTPDAMKEWASGTPQIDINSLSWQMEQERRIRQRQRQNMFNQVQAENAEQQRELESARAAAASQSSSDPAASSKDSNQTSTNAILNMLRDTVAQTNRQAALRKPISAAPACNIDPKTGCHAGHDEKSHPGGCKCGR